MFNMKTIFNWFVFALVATFMISMIALFDRDQVVALVLISYGHIFLAFMAERDYWRKRVKKYQKAVEEFTELVRSTEQTETTKTRLNMIHGYYDTDTILNQANEK